jgi:hypothetical protein
MAARSQDGLAGKSEFGYLNGRSAVSGFHRLAHQRGTRAGRPLICSERNAMREETEAGHGHMLMRLLTERVPVTLLLDLLAPPDAEELYRTEGGGDWRLRAEPAAAV